MKITRHLFITLVLALCLSVTFSSCKKDEKEEAPTITLDEPEQDSQVVLGGEIHIEGNVTHPTALHEMAIYVYKGADTLYSQYPSVHSLTSYHFHVHYQPVDTGLFVISVTAEDHDGRQASETRNVTVIQ